MAASIPNVDGEKKWKYDHHWGRNEKSSPSLKHKDQNKRPDKIIRAKGVASLGDQTLTLGPASITLKLL